MRPRIGQVAQTHTERQVYRYFEASIRAGFADASLYRFLMDIRDSSRIFSLKSYHKERQRLTGVVHACPLQTRHNPSRLSNRSLPLMKEIL